MRQLARRLQKLERRLTDSSLFVPSTPEWLAYWEDRVDRVLTDEDSGLIPLEVIDAILATEDEPGFPEFVLATTTVKVRTTI